MDASFLRQSIVPSVRLPLRSPATRPVTASPRRARKAPIPHNHRESTSHNHRKSTPYNHRNGFCLPSPIPQPGREVPATASTRANPTIAKSLQPPSPARILALTLIAPHVQRLLTYSSSSFIGTSRRSHTPSAGVVYDPHETKA